MASGVLVKNASLWQWPGSTSAKHSAGSVVERSWFCVENGVITDSSTNMLDESRSEPPSEENFHRVIDANHRLIIPGLHDAHIHIAMTGESNYFLNLKGCNSIEMLVSNLSNHSIKFSSAILPWISGVNWDQVVLTIYYSPALISICKHQTELGQYPSRYDLDTACPDRPVILWRACWHIAVVNTKALQLAKLMRLTDDIPSTISPPEDLLESPPGGVVDVEDGIPTGILRERAVELVLAVMGSKSQEEKMKFISEGMKNCLRVGLTAVQTNDASSLLVYRKLQEEDSLPIRIFLTPNYEELSISEDGQPDSTSVYDSIPQPYRPSCVPCSTASIPGAVGRSSSLKSSSSAVDYSSVASRLFVERVKIYADGSLGAETAALKKQSPMKRKRREEAPVQADGDQSSLVVSDSSVSEVIISEEDCAVDSAHTGILTHSREDLTRMVGRARQLGMRIEVHAIGDAAAEQVLDAFDAAGVQSSERPVLTHCQVLDASLVDRMAKGGVVANVQPSFVPTDMRWVQERLTPAQLQYSYAWKTMLDHGVCVAGGSDAPIETCSPLVGMFDAIHRQARLSGTDTDMADSSGGQSPSREVFRPEEVLSFSEALWIYTVGAAYAAGCENFLGSLQVGYAADFVILDAAVLEDTQLLMTTKPKLVVVGGVIAHEGEDDANPIPALTGQQDVADNTVVLCSAVNMGGPYIPGKNGMRPSFARRKVPKYSDPDEISGASFTLNLNCACRLLGRYCAAAYK